MSIFSSLGLAQVRGPAVSSFRERSFQSAVIRNSATRYMVAFAALVFGCMAGVASASAADLPDTKSAPVYAPPPPEFSWTGFYVGVNAGVGIDHFAFPYQVFLPGDEGLGSSGITSDGPVAGGQIGFNYQIEGLPIIGHAVVGIEADDDWGAVRGSTTVYTNNGVPVNIGARFDNFGTLRLRVGYNFDRLLVYLTGGLTYGSNVASYSIPSDGFSGSLRTTHTGLPFNVDTIGLGVEYAIDDHWSVKGEYLYDCVEAYYNSFTPASGVKVGFNSRMMYHIARLGLNYKFDLFGSSTPVVAKY
ncbi:MAG: outer membrane beta-barrel protein [Methylovirgula sp.]|nr:outer membrane beta-barrel protein [Methylovirgula sp.]